MQIILQYKVFEPTEPCLYHVSEVMRINIRYNSSPSGQNYRHPADDIFTCIFVNDKFLHTNPIDNSPALV